MIALNARGRARRPQLRRGRGALPRRARHGARRRASARERPSAGAGRAARARLFAPDLGRLAAEHLLLVFGSLAARRRGRRAARHRRLALAARGAACCSASVAILQTVPSLALLAFLIALVGAIGVVPALIALFLYALLPIVRNTHAGLCRASRARWRRRRCRSA